jgi:hypothetical protein
VWERACSRLDARRRRVRARSHRSQSCAELDCEALFCVGASLLATGCTKAPRASTLPQEPKLRCAGLWSLVLCGSELARDWMHEGAACEHAPTRAKAALCWIVEPCFVWERACSRLDARRRRVRARSHKSQSCAVLDCGALFSVGASLLATGCTKASRASTLPQEPKLRCAGLWSLVFCGSKLARDWIREGAACEHVPARAKAALCWTVEPCFVWERACSRLDARRRRVRARSHRSQSCAVLDCGALFSVSAFRRLPHFWGDASTPRLSTLKGLLQLRATLCRSPARGDKRPFVGLRTGFRRLSPFGGLPLFRGDGFASHLSTQKGLLQNPAAQSVIAAQ